MDECSCQLIDNDTETPYVIECDNCVRKRIPSFEEELKVVDKRASRLEDRIK